MKPLLPQSKTCTILLSMIKDRIAFDLPVYDGLLAGHYVRGQGYGRKRMGGTDDWLLIMTLAGEGRIAAEVGDLRAKAPGLFLLAPGTTHDYGTARKADGWEILWVHFKPPAEWLELLRWPFAAAGIHAFEPSLSAEIESAFREVCQLSVSTGPRRSQFAMNALERLLLLCESQLPHPERQLDDRIHSAIEHIHGHLRLPLALDDLSERVHLSTSRFAHLFRKETGLAPRQYILIQRFQRARTLLEHTSLSIGEISIEVGMDPFYMTKRFKAEVGKSPRQYRQERMKG